MPQTQSILLAAAILLVIVAAGLLIARLLRRRRSRQALVERVAELEALSAAGRAIVAAELDVDALCHLIAEQAGQVIDRTTIKENTPAISGTCAERGKSYSRETSKVNPNFN